jgi:hypothetical protein
MLFAQQLEITIPQANEVNKKQQKETQLNTSCLFVLQARVELDRARRQIQQYQFDIQNYEQRQTKAERVLQRLQAEYESRIAVKFNEIFFSLYHFLIYLAFG